MQSWLGLGPWGHYTKIAARFWLVYQIDLYLHTSNHEYIPKFPYNDKITLFLFSVRSMVNPGS